MSAKDYEVFDEAISRKISGIMSQELRDAERMQKIEEHEAE